MSSSEAAVPFLVLGHARRQQIAAKIGTALGAVFGDSYIRESSLRVEAVADLKSSGAGYACRLNRGPSQQPRGYLFIGQTLLPELFSGARPSLPASMSESPIASAMHSELLVSAVEKLASVTGLSSTNEMERCSLRDLSNEVKGERWYACIPSGQEVSPSFAVLLHPETIARWVPSAAQVTHTERVERRAAAIRANSVRLEVVLGDADVSCADLMHLAVGDVLVLSQDLTAPAVVKSTSGAVVAKAQLGRVGDQLGINILG